MRILTRMLLIALLSTGVVLPSQARAQKAGRTSLRYHWVVGTQFRQVETDTQTEVAQLTPDMGMNGTGVEIYHVTTTQMVRKVYPDSSGLVRSTFTSVSTTSFNGNTTSYPLTGYAVDQRISPRGTIITQKIIGALPPNADLPDEIKNPLPFTYPAGPVGVGSSWHQSMSLGRLLGATPKKLVLNVRVLAFGTVHGQLTVKLGISLRQPVHARAGSASLDALMTGTGTSPQVVATGAPAGVQHASFAMHATVSGPIYNEATHGTITLTWNQEIKPVR